MCPQVRGHELAVVRVQLPVRADGADLSHEAPQIRRRQGRIAVQPDQRVAYRPCQMLTPPVLLR